MSPFLSWLVFIILGGAAYYIYAKPQLPWKTKRIGDQVITTRPEEKTDKRKKKKTEKPPKADKSERGEKSTKVEKEKPQKAERAKPQSATNQKVAPSFDNGSDNDVEEEDSKDDIRRLYAIKSGISLEKVNSSSPKPSKVRGRQSASKQNLPAPTATSRTSSAGAEADIDEKEPFKYPSSSDPSDMLEVPKPGTKVLSITSSTQPLREKQSQSQSTTPEPGTHSKKNQKKIQKAKQAKEEEAAAQKAAREKHKAAQRADEEVRQQRAPAPAVESVWATVNGKDVKSSGAALPGLLDTSNTPEPPSEKSDEEPQTRSSYLDQSQWEEIPSHIQSPNEWTTVPSKKNKDQSKAKQGAASESDVPQGKPEPEKKSRTKPVVTNSTTISIRGKHTNGFEVLSDDAGTQGSPDWAEQDGWEVHPSS